MSSDHAVIKAHELNKHYLMFRRPEDRLKQMVLPKIKRIVNKNAPDYFKVFEAVRNVSLSISKGETVGIIGRNGSGKSTLLQMICGTLTPTSGALNVNGRIAALLELGAGFDSEFTGRENVYMNGAIIGLSRSEIDARFETIEAFADIGEFIDQPAKTYSSGMYVRLAFAVAINSDPNVLVVDEALSVGDEAFQRKCFARIEEIQKTGATILFVSHSAQSIVKLCDRAILMDQGEAIFQGKPKTVVAQYQRLINLNGDAAKQVRDEIKTMALSETSSDVDIEESSAKEELEKKDSLPELLSGSISAMDPAWYDEGLISQSTISYESKGALVHAPRLLNMAGEQVNHLASGRRYALECKLDFTQEAKNFIVGMMIRTVDGVNLAGSHNRRMAANDTRLIPHVKKGETLLVRFEFNCIFRPDAYFITSGVMSEGEADFLHRHEDMLAFKVMIGTDVSDSDVGLVAMQSDLTVSRI